MKLFYLVGINTTILIQIKNYFISQIILNLINDIKITTLEKTSHEDQRKNYL